MNEPADAVRAFIDAYVESIDQLRVLLVLAREPEREWTNLSVASVVKVTPELAQTQLERLAAVGLVSASGAPQAFRYGPRAQELHQMVLELIQLDDRQPVTLIRMVYSRRSSSAQAFADAFRLRGN